MEGVRDYMNEAARSWDAKAVHLQFPDINQRKANKSDIILDVGLLSNFKNIMIFLTKSIIFHYKKL